MAYNCLILFPSLETKYKLVSGVGEYFPLQKERPDSVCQPGWSRQHEVFICTLQLNVCRSQSVIHTVPRASKTGRSQLQTLFLRRCQPVNKINLEKFIRFLLLFLFIQFLSFISV